MLLINNNGMVFPIRLLHAVTFLLAFPICSSEIKNTHIIDDSRPIILFEQFGFSGDGRVDISVKDVSWKSRNPNSKLNASNLGFFLTKDISTILNKSSSFSSDIAVATSASSSSSSCVLSSESAEIIFRFDSLAANSSAHNASKSISDPGSSSYSLMFGNCKKDEFAISMHVHTEMYTVLSTGAKFYLSTGESPLPYIYMSLFTIYSVFLLLWLFTILCFFPKQRIRKLHVIMAALLLVKALKLICAAEDKFHAARSGSPHGWGHVAFYFFGFLKGTMMFTVIVLIGTGWSILKPYLQEREKSVLIVVFPLQVLENVASVVIDETGPAAKDWVAWNEVFLLMDVMCCCAVFMPILWSMKGLREGSRRDGKVGRSLEKLIMFRQFYVVVVGYLYFTRVVAPAVGSAVGFRFEWVRVVLGEVGSLVFYGVVFWMFRPAERNPYLGVGEDEDDDGGGGELLGEDDESF